jgi:hypothetical protein
VTIISINKSEINETLVTEIPIERIDGALNRFRFQVIENYYYYYY